MAKLAVLDPSDLFRAALVSLLQGLGFADLVEAADLEQLQRAASNESPPEIVLITLSRGEESIEDIMRAIRAAFGDTRVVFLAKNLDLDMLSRCFAAGASGYLLENISRDTLGKSLTLVSAGGKVFPPELASHISDLAAKPAGRPAHSHPVHISRLSVRELEILHCLTRGQSNKAIGHTLDIAEATVKVHVKRILRKIHAANRTQAALWAAARGISGIADADESAHHGDSVPVALKPPPHLALHRPIALKTASAK